MKINRGQMSILALLSAFAFASCGISHKTAIQPTGEQKVDIKPTVVSQSPMANEVIKTESQSIKVLGAASLRGLLASGDLTRKISTESASIVTPASASVPGAGSGQISNDSLYIQIPVQLLGQGHLFGGVITTVSDRESSTLGRLKLTDLPPIHVRPMLSKPSQQTENPSVFLVGCASKCSETSPQEPIIGLPVLGQTRDGENLVIDVSKFGETLDLMAVLDPEGAYSGLKTIATRTTAVDMSDATIVWDVEHKMVPKDSDGESNPQETIIGARYYLKLESGLNSAFVSRKQVPGVGFFTTSTGSEEVITRFSQTDFNGRPIHYFIKNVPAEYQAAFAASFDGWNATFKEEIGRELISYEFVAPNDPKNALLVPGDVRYNILEWDLVNQAPYGGLGPSIASQTTGETFSANVLVQGPTIVTIYKEWFKVAAQAQELVASGKTSAADALVIAARNKIFAKLPSSKALPVHQLNLGTSIHFRHHAQDVRLEDQLASRQDFFDLPKGETYDSYMAGYFKDMITHELGHNLGLRHNFKGNLLATADGAHPSGSVMEYLNREFRHKDSIGEYDHMAIKYGYAGVAPTRTDIFCTDENVVDSDNPTFSAECSRDDATNDPFGYLGTVLDRALDRIVAPKSKDAPTWAVADLTRELTYSLTGRLVYGTSADATSKTWLDWKKDNRPRRANAISQFVFRTIQGQLCAPEIRKAADFKDTDAAKEATKKNLADLDAVIESVGTQFNVLPRIKCY